jgi:hypothetical protein
MDGEWVKWAIEDMVAKGAAHVIIEKHRVEVEQARIDAMQEQFLQDQEKLVELKAQMTIMAEVLRTAQRFIMDDHLSDEGPELAPQEVWELTDKALAFVPRVAWSETVELVPSERKGWPALFMYALGNEADNYMEKGEYRGELMGYPEGLEGIVRLLILRGGEEE